jgi:hypothetical protein
MEMSAICDLRHCAPEAQRAGVALGSARRRRADRPRLRLVLDLAVHLPAHPEQQDAAGERQANDGQQLHGHGRKGDAQRDGSRNAPEDHPGAQIGRHAGGGETNDDGIVAGEDQVDDDDLGESDKFGLKRVQHL